MAAAMDSTCCRPPSDATDAARSRPASAAFCAAASEAEAADRALTAATAECSAATAAVFAADRAAAKTDSGGTTGAADRSRAAA